jgi:hypothetical protein
MQNFLCVFSIFIFSNMQYFLKRSNQGMHKQIESSSQTVCHSPDLCLYFSLTFWSCIVVHSVLLTFLQCQLHGEVFTMFCTRKKTLLCMKCFRETSADAKSHCMDLETAYNVGGKRLERAITVCTTFLSINEIIQKQKYIV